MKSPQNDRPTFPILSLGGIISWRALVLIVAGCVCVSTSRATSVVPPEFDELVNQADYIVQAIVVSVTPDARPRASGTASIHSLVNLQVERTIAGKPPSPLVLDILGGTVGDRELRVTGAPRYEVGERAVFFVQGNGRQIHPLVRMMHGLYPLDKDGSTGRTYVARADHSPLNDVREVSRPMGERTSVSAPLGVRATDAALTPEQFEATIKAHVTNPRLLEK